MKRILPTLTAVAYLSVVAAMGFTIVRDLLPDRTAEAQTIVVSLTVEPVDCQTLQLTWSDTTGRPQSYAVERSVDNGVTFVDLIILPLRIASTADLEVYVDTNLLPATPYSYRVRLVGPPPPANVQVIELAPDAITLPGEAASHA